MPKRRGTSPTQRTLHFVRQNGGVIDVAEKWVSFHQRRDNPGPPGVRRDLFGFIDLIELRPGVGIVAIQCSGTSGHAEHKRKILSCECFEDWVRCGGLVELWSWRKVKKVRGGKQMIWQPRIEQIDGDLDLATFSATGEKT